MRINRHDLLQSLESVQPGLTTRDVVEQSSCFVFKDGEVFTFNDEVACRKPCSLDIEAAVPALPLLNMLRRLPEDELDIELLDSEIIIEGKRRKSGIRIQLDIADHHNEKMEKGENWKKLHAEFSDAIYVAQQCVGKDESQYTTTCVHIHPKWIESCDNTQAIRYHLKTRVEEPILIRGSSIKHIVSLDMVEFAETETWIHFRNPSGLVLSCRRDVQDFGDNTDLFEMDGNPLTLPKGLGDAAAKAEVFSAENADENEVTVDIRPGRIRVRSQGTSGWYSESKKLASYKGDPLQFNVPPSLLIELVKKYNDCEVSQDKLKVVVGNFTYVVALGDADKNPEA